MTYIFILYLETLQEILLNLCSLGRNIRGLTANKLKEHVLIIDMLHFEKYLPPKYLSTFVQHLVPYFHRSYDDKSASSVNVKLYAVGTNTQISVVTIALA